MLNELRQVLIESGMTEEQVEQLLSRAQARSRLHDAIMRCINGLRSQGVREFELRLQNDGNWTATLHTDEEVIELEGTVKTTTEPQGSQETGSRSEWARVLELARRYEEPVSDNERRAISWFAGNVLRRLRRKNPGIVYDPEYQELAQKWNQRYPDRVRVPLD